MADDTTTCLNKLEYKNMEIYTHLCPCAFSTPYEKTHRAEQLSMVYKFAMHAISLQTYSRKNTHKNRMTKSARPDEI
jgi:hypothetical protein